MNVHSAAAPIVQDSERVSRFTAATVAFLLGSFLIFAVGFAHPSKLHNAAHDTRHALSFPCH
jgi:cobalt transporter subunit CbtB